jgi:hypothetical protein
MRKISTESEFIASHEVEGKNVSLFREYYGNGVYKYYINWGDHSQGPVINETTQLKSPKGNNITIAGAIRQFREKVEASRYVTFKKNIENHDRTK